MLKGNSPKNAGIYLVRINIETALTTNAFIGRKGCFSYAFHNTRSMSALCGVQMYLITKSKPFD